MSMPRYALTEIQCFSCRRRIDTKIVVDSGLPVGKKKARCVHCEMWTFFDLPKFDDGMSEFAGPRTTLKRKAEER